MTSADLRQLRLDLGLTQTEWGRWLGIGRRHVAKLEAGLEPSETLRLLAEAYRDGWRPSPSAPER